MKENIYVIFMYQKLIGKITYKPRISAKTLAT